MKKLYIFLFFVILFSNIVYTVPEPKTQVNIEDRIGLTIIFPKEVYHMREERINMPFDILDYNYTKLTNETTNCTYTVIEKQGEIIDSGFLIYNETLDFWNFFITKENTDKLGVYNYYIYCEDLTLKQNGFVSGTYEITLEGKEPTYDTSSGISITLFLILLNLALFMIPLKAKIMNDEFADYTIKRCLIILGMFFLSLNISAIASIAEAGHLPLLNTLFRYLYFVNWIIYISMVAFTPIFINKILKLWNIKKIRKRMGEDEED